MKVLTIIPTIFLPLTFLAGIWGMNVYPSASPWNMPGLSDYNGYLPALLAISVPGITLALYFRWKKSL